MKKNLFTFLIIVANFLHAQDTIRTLDQDTTRTLDVQFMLGVTYMPGLPLIKEKDYSLALDTKLKQERAGNLGLDFSFKSTNGIGFGVFVSNHSQRLYTERCVSWLKNNDYPDSLNNPNSQITTHFEYSTITYSVSARFRFFFDFVISDRLTFSVELGNLSRLRLFQKTDYKNSNLSGKTVATGINTYNLILDHEVARGMFLAPRLGYHASERLKLELGIDFTYAQPEVNEEFRPWFNVPVSVIYKF